MMSEWGNPPVIRRVSRAEYIGSWRRTRGTETSKYPEERKSTETPWVVASERGPGQWLGIDNWNSLERLAIVGDSPVQVQLISSPWVGRNTRNSAWTWGDHSPSLSITMRPIVNKYREGKVKSTPIRGVKQTLKPDAYNQSEGQESWRRTFCIMGQRLNLASELKPIGVGAAKASVNSAF